MRVWRCRDVQGVLAKWLAKPLVVAWKSSKSPDHESENYFVKKDGYVVDGAAASIILFQNVVTVRVLATHHDRRSVDAESVP